MQLIQTTTLLFAKHGVSAFVTTTGTFFVVLQAVHAILALFAKTRLELLLVFCWRRLTACAVRLLFGEDFFAFFFVFRDGESVSSSASLFLGGEADMIKY